MATRWSRSPPGAPCSCSGCEPAPHRGDPRDIRDDNHDYNPGAMFRGTERFEIVRRIGEGGMGVVYEAYDRDQRTRIALKTLRLSARDSLLRFKNEFRALRDVYHPNLVGLGELCERDGAW